MQVRKNLSPRIRSGDTGFICKVWADGSFWVTHPNGGIITVGRDDLIMLERAKEAT